MADDLPAGFKLVKDAPAAPAVPSGFKLVTEAPQQPLGPYQYTGMGGQKVESPTPYSAAADPFTKTGMGETFMRNLPQSPAIPLAATMTAGAAAPLAGIPAAIGRVGAAGVAGAGQAAARGEDPTTAGFLDAVVAGLTEGVVSGVSSGAKLGPVKLGLKEWGAPSRAFEWATQAPAKALDLVEQRLPKSAVLNVPSLSSKPMTVTEAVKSLAKLTDEKYQIARGEIASEFSRLDIQKYLTTPSGQFVKGPGPSAGQVLKKFTSKERFEPGSFAEMAESVRGALTSNFGRSVADAIMDTPIAGVPLGGLVAAALAPGIAEHIPYIKGLVEKDRGYGGR